MNFTNKLSQLYAKNRIASTYFRVDVNSGILNFHENLEFSLFKEGRSVVSKFWLPNSGVYEVKDRYHL